VLTFQAEATQMQELERSILDRVGAVRAATVLFVLGAPRTGSTFLYQAITSAFALPFIDNLTNQFFPRTPILGLLLGSSLREPIAFSSSYGKTVGLRQPSEGSAVMAHWFGGGHPSQIVSSRILEGRETHLIATLAAADAFFRGPLVIKNAWNCFRIEYLAAALPAANFVWIRRDIRTAAKSDLRARYAVQGSGLIWNSATPANVEALRARPCWEQVVENQFEFGKAISSTSVHLAKGRFAEVWYEDLVADVQGTMLRLGEQLKLLQGRNAASFHGSPAAVEAESTELDAAESLALERYVDENRSRLHSYLKS
jgi:hypothetical protein